MAISFREEIGEAREEYIAGCFTAHYCKLQSVLERTMMMKVIRLSAYE